MSKLQPELMQYMQETFPAVIFSHPTYAVGENGYEIQWDATDPLQVQRLHFALDCFVAGWRAARKDA